MISTSFNCSAIVFPHVTHFWLDVYVNSQNNQILGSEKQEFVVARHLHPQKIVVVRIVC